MSFLDDLFGGGRGSAAEDLQRGSTESAANREKWYNQALEFLKPYMEGGGQQFGEMGDFMSQLGQGLQSKMFDEQGEFDPTMGYETSPYAKRQMDLINERMQNEGALTGRIHSSDYDKSMQENLQGVVSKDMQDYLNNMFREQGMYQSGAGQMGGMGYGANTNAFSGGMDVGRGISGDIMNRAMAQGMGDIASSQGTTNLLGKLFGSFFGG